MARNMAKSFATMTLLYWAPVISGSGVKYDRPVTFKGFYIGNAKLGDGGIGDVVFSGGGTRDNLVLFYLCEPAVDGYVCWDKTYEELDAAGQLDMPPDTLAGTSRIKSVTTLVMPGTKTPTLADKAFFASVS